MELGALLGTLRSVEPDIWESWERSLILPRNLGDLDNPEIMNCMREKIQAIRELKEMRGVGSISREDYGYMKTEILYRI